MTNANVYQGFLDDKKLKEQKLFHNILITCVRAKTVHHYQRCAFLKKTYCCIFGSKPDIFN